MRTLAGTISGIKAFMLHHLSSHYIILYRLYQADTVDDLWIFQTGVLRQVFQAKAYRLTGFKANTY